jgi:hypothetical protein
MFSKIVAVVSFGAIALVTFGCSGTDNGSEDTSASTSEDLSAKAMLACTDDAECVAIEKPACCPNGMKVAVNSKHVKAYENANKCTNPPQVCPLFVIDDTRVAACVSQKCEMVKGP